MADTPADPPVTAPAPELLQPKAANPTDSPATPTADPAAVSGKLKPGPNPLSSLHRGGYRPSHKATFIGAIVVVLILGINVGIVGFVVKKQSKTTSSISSDTVTLSQGALDKVGINRSTIGSSGTELVVNPDAKFNNKVEVGGDVSVGGQLKLNSKFSATDASLTKLSAGDTSLTQLNVNGNGTVSTLNLRNDLIVTGTSRLQGEVIVNKLLTVNNNATIAGSLAVGGTLSVQTFHASSLTSDTTLTIGGHVVTRGLAPFVNPGTALGSNGTVSISGNDASGTVAVNIGAGGGGGVLASVSFRAAYGSIPHVVVSGVGRGSGTAYVNRSATGFSIGIDEPLAPGTYAFDYIVVQ